jgi:cytochrome c oxidase subunit I
MGFSSDSSPIRLSATGCWTPLWAPTRARCFPLEFPAPMYSIDAGMLDPSSGGGATEASRSGFFHSTLLRTDHKVMGLRYLWLALFSVLLGVVMSLAMRIHLVWPAAHLPFLAGLENSPERYAALTLLHGSLMVLMVLTAAPQAGFGNYLLPIQIGAGDMAFPTINLLAFWVTVASLVGVTTAFLLPLQTGLTLWVASIALFCAAALANALNFSVTTIDMRAKGMTFPRLPITVWAWLINAILSLLIFSILLAVCVYLLADRILGTHFFSVPALLPNASRNSQAAALSGLWQRLFWFFAQAQVYVSILPCFGITTHLIATFSRKPVWAERAVVLALCAVGLLGFCIWGQHTFTAGLDPYSPPAFALLASSLGLPASILLLSWLGTLWNAKVRLTTAVLFALAFVSLFLSGGLSGLFLARANLGSAVTRDDFITGHFHLVMGIAATFALLGALFFWFPKMFGRSLDERLGKIHFWVTFAGVYCIFMPMHWLGLISRFNLPSEASLTLARAATSTIPSFVTIATLVTVAAQGIFMANFVKSLLRRSEAVEKNPWRATTLEWSLPSPPPLGNFAGLAPVVHRGAYEFGGLNRTEDFVTQSHPTDGAPPAMSGGTDPGLQPLAPA